MGYSKKGFLQSTKKRRYRRFGESFKQEKVKDLESGSCSVSEICKAYEVSDTAVYKWLEKYSSKSKPNRTIVESKSDTQKILALQKKIADLERSLGQKQIQLEFQEKLIEIAETKYGLEIKKNSKQKR